MNPAEVLLCLFLILLSSVFSATEVAIFSLSRFQIRRFKDTVPRIYTTLQTLLGDSSGLLITILVANEVVNVTLATMITSALARNWSQIAPWMPQGPPTWTLQLLVGILIISPILVFACEISPKVTGAKINQVVAPLVTRPIYLLYRLFFPVRFGLQFVARAVNQDGETDVRLKEDDFLMMVEEGQREGSVDQTEVGLIKNVFQLDDRRVQEIMIPLEKVHSFAADLKIREAIKVIQKKQYYRVPVYSGSKNNIVGVLFTKDLIVAKLDQSALESSVESMMRRPFFIGSEMQISTVFKYMKQNKKHLIIVQDQKRRAIGITTMTDLLNAIFRLYRRDR